MKQFLRNSDIKVNDYKYQIALKKPWYMNQNKFIRYARQFIQNLPNYKMRWIDGYLIIDLYFDSKGLKKDEAINEYESVVYQKDKKVFMSFKRKNKDIITNRWI